MTKVFQNLPNTQLSQALISLIEDCDKICSFALFSFSTSVQMRLSSPISNLTAGFINFLFMFETIMLNEGWASLKSNLYFSNNSYSKGSYFVFHFFAICLFIFTSSYSYSYAGFRLPSTDCTIYLISYFYDFYDVWATGFFAGGGTSPSKNFYSFVRVFGRYALFSPESSYGFYDFSYTMGLSNDDLEIWSFSLY